MNSEKLLKAKAEGIDIFSIDDGRGFSLLLPTPLFQINQSGENLHRRLYHIPSMGLIRDPRDYALDQHQMGNLIDEVFIQVFNRDDLALGFINRYAFDWVSQRFGFDRLALMVETNLFSEFCDWIKGEEQFAAFADLTASFHDHFGAALLNWRAERIDFMRSLVSRSCPSRTLIPYDEPLLARLWLQSVQGGAWFSGVTVDDGGVIQCPVSNSIFQSGTAMDDIRLANCNFGFSMDRGVDNSSLQSVMTSRPHLTPLLLTCATSTDTGLDWLNSPGSNWFTGRDKEIENEPVI